MKYAFRRARSVFQIIMSLAFLFQTLLVLAGVSTFSTGGFYLLGTVAGTVFVLGIMIFFEYLRYSRVAEDINADVDNIFFAVYEMGYDIEWIKENGPRFNHRVTQERDAR